MRDFKFILMLVCCFTVFLSCTSQGEQKTEDSATVLTQYTCPMHPQVLKNENGTCPICAMDLVPFKKSEGNKLTIDPQRQLLANISTTVFGKANVSSGATILNARLVVNPEQASVVSAKVAGRVQKLFVKEIGVTVNKGQALYQIYSEELAALQQEYLMALAQLKVFPNGQVEQQLVSAAKQKLRLYGLRVGQLKDLDKKQKNILTVFATESGTVQEILINEGGYLSEGSPVMRLENYKKLWVEADVYPTEMKQIKVGQKMKLQVNGFENKPQMVTINFINPVLKNGVQLMQIRAQVFNKDLQWQAGLSAQLLMVQNTENVVENILPINAIITDAKGSHVWLKTGAQTFVAKRVGVGAMQQHGAVILSGLSNDDVVVKTGAYLLFSEYQLKTGKHPLAD